MKKYSIRIFILLFLLLSQRFVCLSSDIDSTNLTHSDSMLVGSNVKTEKGLDLVLIAGLGMTIKSMWGYWDYYFPTAPVFALGLEIPFTKSYDFAIQLYYHYWIANHKEGREPNQYYKDRYNQLSNDLYSGFGLSGVIKYYINIFQNKFRISLHLGYIILSDNIERTGMDFGLGLYYYIDKSWIINLSGNFNFGKISLGSTSTDVPNLLMLNFYYKFKL